MSMKEALDRLRRVVNGERWQQVYNHEPVTFYDEQWEASQELLRLTDPTPIDEPWLYTLGFAKDSMCKRAEFVAKGVTLSWWEPCKTFEVDVNCDPTPLPITTRGELRSLARLLKIELKEIPVDPN